MEFICTIIFISILLALTILYLFTNNTKTRKLINKIPGPPSFPIIGNATEFFVPQAEQWHALNRILEKYHPTSKIWMFHWPVVSIGHPDDIEVLLSNQQNITKSLFYDFLRPWLKEGLLTSAGSKWRQRRRTLTPAFHLNLLQDFLGVFAETAERMIKSLKEEGNEVVKDVFSLLEKYTLSVICETAMGTILQNDDSKQNEYTDTVEKMGKFLYYRATRPWLKNDWIFSLTREGQKHAKCLKILHNFTTEIIKKRKEFHNETGGKYLNVFSSENKIEPDSNVAVHKKRLAMLDLLIAVQKEKGTIDDLGICEEVDTFIFEGHDTTNAGLGFTVLLLATNKEIQARARAEIDALLKESKGKLGMAELQNMHYVERCIKETLRLYPVVPILSRNLTENLHLNKYIVPPGTTTMISINHLHRNPDFWPEPEVFDPDRFLPERSEGRHPYSYIPFSAGPRNCIGRKFAMFEMKMFIGMLLHNFYLEPTANTKLFYKMPTLILKPPNPVHIKFVPIVR